MKKLGTNGHMSKDSKGSGKESECSSGTNFLGNVEDVLEIGKCTTL